MRPGSADGTAWRGRSQYRTHMPRSEEHTSELQSHVNLVCRLLLEKKKNTDPRNSPAFYQLEVAGAGRLVVDVAARTLLPRLTPITPLCRVLRLTVGSRQIAMARGS